VLSGDGETNAGDKTNWDGPPRNDLSRGWGTAGRGPAGDWAGDVVRSSQPGSGEPESHDDRDQTRGVGQSGAERTPEAVKERVGWDGTKADRTGRKESDVTDGGAERNRGPPRS